MFDLISITEKKMSFHHFIEIIYLTFGFYNLHNKVYLLYVNIQYIIKRLQTPIHQAFSFRIGHIFIVILYTVSHSSLNNNENIPYPI